MDVMMSDYPVPEELLKWCSFKDLIYIKKKKTGKRKYNKERKAKNTFQLSKLFLKAQNKKAREHINTILYNNLMIKNLFILYNHELKHQNSLKQILFIAGEHWQIM